MATCLGVYIDNNLIKYAKVSKNNETTKVESFGVKFYEDGHIENSIKQIVEETYSYKVPISINSNAETYNKFEVFSLLSKKDIDGVVKTEFESLCYDKNLNKNLYEERYVLANSNNHQDEKIKVIHVSVPKTTISQIKNQFGQYKINSISPIGVTIPNLIKKEKNGNYVVVNIENETTVTKVINNKIGDVQVINLGTKEILNNINQKENSYSKSYEICKNITIYTENDKDLQYEENEYLEDVMPTLFNIVTQVRRIIEESFEEISKIYITGTGAIINNIDIYFQDYFKNSACEILRPGFIGNNSKLNIKDYIEVNSAISLALQGINKNTINFTSESKISKILMALTSDVSLSSKNKKGSSGINLVETLEKFNEQYKIGAFTCGFVLIAYLVGATIINNLMDDRIQAADKSINDTNYRIQELNWYAAKFDNQTAAYERLIENIDNANSSKEEDKKYRNAIPNLLNKIMVTMPTGVELVSIENTTERNIVIKARATEYQQIAFFKTKLKTEGILENIVSDTGVTEVKNKKIYINITIEGELP